MRWIDAPDHMRLKLYTAPDARKRLGDKEIMRQEISQSIRALRANHAIATSDRDRKKANRRIKSELAQWRAVCESHRHLLKVIEMAAA